MKKTQYGWVFFIVLFAINGLAFYERQATKDILLVSTLSLVLLLLFFKLTFSVTDKYVKFSLGVGLIKGKYKFEDIISCKPLSYVPLGWGIRLKPGAILFNVSGNKAVELEVKNKKRKIWIGTNCPEELSKYINTKRMK